MIYLKTTQTVFPKSIYIGDKAEIRCNFSADTNLTTGALSLENFTSSIDYTTYEINNISLQSIGENSYSLVINFVPWHTGPVSFPDYELYLADNVTAATATTITTAASKDNLYGTIHFDEINVLSLVEQQGINSLKEFEAPVLLPGTTYKIYASIILFIILLFAFIRLIVKRRAVIFWFKTIKLKYRYKKNKNNTIKALKQLPPDRDSATLLQKIMREYLEVRLEYPFTKTLTSEMSLAFDKATLSLADDNRQDAFEEIISVFIRTDYIRFSSATGFEKNEFSSLIDRLINAITIIECEETKKTKTDKKSLQSGGENA